MSEGYEGSGITIAFSSGFLADVLNVNHSGFSRPSISGSSMGDPGAEKFFPSAHYDPGQLEVEMVFAAETTPPIDGAREAVTVTYPSAGAGGNSTWAAQGFLTDFAIRAPWKDRMLATATLKLSGAITVTP